MNIKNEIEEIHLKHLEKGLDKFSTALMYANLHHQTDTRKLTDLPYMNHLIAVSSHIKNMLNQLDTENEDLEVAGILHDIVEDTNVTIEKVEMLFGSKVATYVLSNTEDKTKSWEERKDHTIRNIKNQSVEENILLLADKLSNAYSLYMAHLEEGDEVFGKFKRGYAKQYWYFYSIYYELKEFFSSKNIELKELTQYEDCIKNIFK